MRLNIARHMVIELGSKGYLLTRRRRSEAREKGEACQLSMKKNPQTKPKSF